jgi:DNA helicase-2/ATP-dependent DNA helicase PcrA
MSEVGELILHDLNPAQREAVTAPDGPLLVFAGAGSGKTRVLTRRIAWMIAERGLRPSEVFAVTFTNKAAGEMQRRVEELLGGHAHGMWVHTFHSACARLLRSHAERVGRKPGFSIYDEADQQTLIKEIAPRCDLDLKEYPPRQIAGWFDRAKNEAEDPATLERHVPATIRQKYRNLAELYARRMREANAFDFGDLIVETIRLLRENEDVHEGVRRRFQSLLVDEFQDTNRAQYLLLELLLGGRRNLTVVGDDDQSIYRWRGARLANILEFKQQFPDARVVILGTNYRSSARILQAADAIISHNIGRQPKQMDTPNPPGAAIVRALTDDEYDEARFIAATIDELRLRHGLRPAQIAVFYRINAQSRIIEEKLLERGIPYKVVGGLRFYDRKEIKDAVAYLRLAVNADDAAAFERAVNMPPRGIGDKTLERIRDFAAQQGATLLAACVQLAAGAGEGVAGKARLELGRFARLFAAETPDLFADTPSRTAARLLNESGYLPSLEKSEKIEDKTRVENLRELLKSIEEFEKEFQGEATLPLFLEKVSLLSDPDLYDERADAVALMTLHAAKGLEFPAVIMAGLEENLLPHSRSLNDVEELEEERRLCYVGVTRAQKYLYWTAASWRRSFGGAPAPTRLSRFWNDLPAEVVEEFGLRRPYAERRAAQPSLLGVPTAGPDPREPVYDSSDSQDPEDQRRQRKLLAPGCRVRHPHFGAGIVVTLTGHGSLARATVHFERFGQKTLVLQFANLTYEGPGT